MDFGIIIIGSELLTGKRRDSHLAHTIEALGKRGLDLAWCQILPDAPTSLTRTLRSSMAGQEAVFCFGGIGSTPDDHTRQCAAAAAGLPLIRHPEAAALITERFQSAAYPHRIRMADLPADATLIPNPVNRIPGFSLGHHHFLPGFPQMAWPMQEWVLEQVYGHLAGAPHLQVLLTLRGTSEGQIVTLLEAFVARFPEVQLACLPHLGEDGYRETELGVRGKGPQVWAAAAWLQEELTRAGFSWERVP
jgi:molybdopterin-biosynthesis enzyme MoeA-like protein